jgi:hypothetical protein
MTRATLTRPTNQTAVSAGAGTAPPARPEGQSAPNAGRRGSEIPTPATANQSTRQASTIAGVALLAMSVLSAVGYLLAVKGLVVSGSAARTAKNIAGHEALFRFGIVSLYVVAALDVVVAWALYRMFKPVSEGVSKLAAGLRVAYAAVFVVAISQLIGALRAPSHALGHINTFTNIWDGGLVLFGLGLFVLAYLAHRSGYAPKLLSVLLAIAGFGYVFDTATRVLAPGSSSDISAITGIGEFVFAIWLVTRGRRINSSDSESANHSIGAAR